MKEPGQAQQPSPLWGPGYGLLQRPRLKAPPFLGGDDLLVIECVRRYDWRCMIKVLLLIFEPVATWEKIDRAQRSVAFILFLYLLPLLLITLAGEAYGISQWGKQQGMLGQIVKVPREAVIFYETAQLGLSLLVVFVGARLIRSIAESLHRHPTYTQAFTTVAYALAPLFMIRLLDATPAMNAWVTWGIGICLTLAVFYNGLPRVLKPDPATALGLYFLSVLVLAVLTGLARFVATLLLQQKFSFPI